MIKKFKKNSPPYNGIDNNTKKTESIQKWVICFFSGNKDIKERIKKRLDRILKYINYKFPIKNESYIYKFLSVPSNNFDDVINEFKKEKLIKYGGKLILILVDDELFNVQIRSINPTIINWRKSCENINKCLVENNHICIKGQFYGCIKLLVSKICSGNVNFGIYEDLKYCNI